MKVLISFRCISCYYAVGQSCIFRTFIYFICKLNEIFFPQKAASSYQEMISNINTPKVDVKIAEMRLTWLVYIIGSAVGGRVSFNSNDEHDSMDGELVCR